jgi:phenylacetate-CoA ligase
MGRALDIRKRILERDNLANLLLGSVVRFLPAVIKYGKTYVATSALINRYERNDLEIAEYLDSKLENVVSKFNLTAHAKSRSIHLNSKEPLESYPLMRVGDLPSDPIELCPIGEENIEMCSTSGSSGTPKVFFLGNDRGPVETAFVHHAWKQAGFKHTKARAVLRGLDSNRAGDLLKWNPLLQELQISPFLLTEKNAPVVWAEIVRRSIRYIHGYPSSLEVLARGLSHGGLGVNYASKIKGLFLISEQIYEHQIGLFHQVFPNAKQVSFYGQSEKVAFAFQDSSDPHVYNFSPLYGIAELLSDSGKRVETKGARGNLFGTGLIYRGSRFVRYELGDTAELVALPSPENQHTLSVRNIQSWRSSASIIGISGEKFSLAAVNMHVRELLDVSKMQFVQRRPGELELYLKTRDDQDLDSVTAIADKLQAKLGNSLKVIPFQVDNIELNSRGKAKLFVSYLDDDV